MIFLLHYVFPSVPHFSSILIYSTPTLSSLSRQTIPFTHFYPYLPFSFLSLVPLSPNVLFPFFFSLSPPLFHPFRSLFPLPFPSLIFFSLSLSPFHPFFLLSFSHCLPKTRMTEQRKFTPNDHNFYIMQLDTGLYVDGKHKGALI